MKPRVVFLLLFFLPPVICNAGKTGAIPVREYNLLYGGPEDLYTFASAGVNLYAAFTDLYYLKAAPLLPARIEPAVGKPWVRSLLTFINYTIIFYYIMSENSRVTVKEVARLAGVSTATVSRSFNDDPKVRKKTKDKVLSAAKQLNYRFNDAARCLKTKKSRTIGLIIPYLQNEFFMEIAEGIEANLKIEGYYLIVSKSNYESQTERESVQLLQEKAVDGLLIIPCTEDGTHLKDILHSDIPIVSIDRKFKNLNISAILTDNEHGAFEATKALIEDHPELGIPAYIGGYNHVTTAEERFSGYLKALQHFGHSEKNAIVIQDEFDKTLGGYKAMEKLLKINHRPFSIFIANYFMHIGATEYLLEKKIPEKEVVIAAFDYSPMYIFLRYCKTFVTQPHLKMGEIAVKKLINLMANSDNPDCNNEIRLNTSLIKLK